MALPAPSPLPHPAWVSGLSPVPFSHQVRAQPCCGDPTPPPPIRSPILSGQRTQHPHPRGWNQIRRPVLLHPPRRDRAEPPPSPPPPFTYPNWTELRSGLDLPGLAGVCLEAAERELPGGRTAGARSSAGMRQRWYPGEPAALSPPAPAPREGLRPSPPPLAGPGAGHLPPQAGLLCPHAWPCGKLTPSLHPVAARHPRAALSSLAQILATLSRRCSFCVQPSPPCLFQAILHLAGWHSRTITNYWS